MCKAIAVAAPTNHQNQYYTLAKDRACDPTEEWMIDASRGVSLGLGLVVVVAQVTVWSVLLGFLYWVVPEFEQVLTDFEMKVPAAMQAVVVLGRLVHEYWFVGLALAAVACGVVVRVFLSAQPAAERQEQRMVAFVLTIVPPLLLLAGTGAVVVYTWLQLFVGLS